jgi:hypothetical protein
MKLTYKSLRDLHLDYYALRDEALTRHAAAKWSAEQGERGAWNQVVAWEYILDYLQEITTTSDPEQTLIDNLHKLKSVYPAMYNRVSRLLRELITSPIPTLPEEATMDDYDRYLQEKGD